MVIIAQLVAYHKGHWATSRELKNFDAIKYKNIRRQISPSVIKLYKSDTQFQE